MRNYEGGSGTAIHSIYIATSAGVLMGAVTEASLVPDRGIEGDRYFLGVGSFSRWPGAGRALTLIEQEAIDAIGRDYGIDLRDGRSRRNIVTVGVKLADLIGKTFRLGVAVLRGVRPAEPCGYLGALRLDHGGYEGRGGLRADVLEAGRGPRGDAVDVVLLVLPGASARAGAEFARRICAWHRARETSSRGRSFPLRPARSWRKSSWTSAAATGSSR